MAKKQNVSTSSGIGEVIGNTIDFGDKQYVSPDVQATLDGVQVIYDRNLVTTPGAVTD